MDAPMVLFLVIGLGIRGTYKYGDRVIVSYDVGDAKVLESHRREKNGEAVTWIRVLNVERSSHDLILRVAHDNKSVSVAVQRDNSYNLEKSEGSRCLRIPAKSTPIDFELHITRSGDRQKGTGRLEERKQAPFLKQRRSRTCGR